jgi:hypothetical protein
MVPDRFTQLAARIGRDSRGSGPTASPAHHGATWKEIRAERPIGPLGVNALGCRRLMSMMR